MSDIKTSPNIDMAPTSALLATGSPKGMYTFFLLSLAKNYFETMRDGANRQNIDAATAALISFCPNREKRGELWNLYVTERDKPDSAELTASVFAIGELVSYLSDVLEFEETSTGGLM